MKKYNYFYTDSHCCFLLYCLFFSALLPISLYAMKYKTMSFDSECMKTWFTIVILHSVVKLYANPKSCQTESTSRTGSWCCKKRPRPLTGPAFEIKINKWKCTILSQMVWWDTFPWEMNQEPSWWSECVLTVGVQRIT